jgi:hypothetical protein
MASVRHCFHRFAGEGPVYIPIDLRSPNGQTVRSHNYFVEDLCHSPIKLLEAPLGIQSRFASKALSY